MGNTPSSGKAGRTAEGDEDRETQNKGHSQGTKYGNNLEVYLDPEEGYHKEVSRGDVLGIWKGETVFIIGGGPSLIGFDYSPIHNRKVIGVNNAYRLGDWVDICWFGDLKWLHWHQKELRSSYKGIIAHCNTRSDLRRKKWMVPFHRGKPLGIDINQKSVAWNRCSGLSAINLAYHMGASTVFLLGFDMKHDNKQKNWHKDHKEDQSLKLADRRYAHFLVAPQIIWKDAQRLGLNIINGNPDSAIEQFPKMTLTEFLDNESESNADTSIF